MKRLLVSLPLIVSFGFLLSLGIAYAAPFTNGSFETGPNPGGTFVNLSGGSTAITGWEVLPNNIDYVGPLWVAEDGARSLDLNGSALGGIQQIFDTVAGDQYQATFWLAGNPAGGPIIKTMEVAATGNPTQEYSFDITGHNFTNMGWTQETYSFLAPGPNVTLSFMSTSINNVGALNYYGPALDNVSILNLGPPVTGVPEPATMLLLGSGIVGMVPFIRRKFKK
jgi:choice-of-anchor C domain-containing protein